MALNNKWLTPLERSFSAIRQKLFDALDNIKDPNDSNKPLITDRSEGNIFTIIISMFSAIAEVLHFYVDNVARESFLPTARRYESLLKHSQLVDYHPKAAVASKVNVTLTRNSKNSGELALSSGTQLNDSNGNPWTLMRDETFPEGSTLKQISLVQCTPSTNQDYNTDDLVDGRYLTVQLNDSTSFYMEGSMNLRIGNTDYALVETLAKSSPDDNHYIVESLRDGLLLITFGDGTNGKLVDTTNTSTIYLSYQVTKGEAGNIASGTIDTTWPNNTTIQVRNAIASGGGSDYEDFETLQRRIPLSIKTLDVAISKEDFKDLAMTRSGVGQAAIEYECGRKLNIYIATTDGEPAPENLCTEVENYILQHCPLTTWVHVKPVGITNIILDITVTGHKSYKEDYIRNQVVEALTNKYSAANAEIGGSVRLSDIYALIDNLPSVDYLRVNKFYLKPWPTVMRGIQLSIDTYNLIKCDRNMEYILEVNENNQFNIYSKYNGFQGTSPLSNLSVDDNKNGVQFTMVITNSANLQAGYKYSIYITQNSIDYEEPGYNIPAFIEDDLHLEVNEVL